MCLTIIGAGHAGLSTGIVLAYLGHRIILPDKNTAIVSALKNGTYTIYEYSIVVQRSL